MAGPPAPQDRRGHGRDGPAGRPAPVGGGRTFSLGDIAVGTAAGYVSLRYPDFQWRTPHPDLALFSDRLAQRQSFKDSVPVAQTITDKVV